MAKVQKIQVHKIPMNSPSDVSGIESLIESGELKPETIVAIVAKTEGNGLVNDFSRGFAELTLKILLAEKMGISRDEMGDRISLVMSGGCPGLMSPHFTVFAREWVEGEESPEKRLAVGIARSRDILPEEIGRMGQIEVVADAVREATADACISDSADIHFVQVKNPLLTKPRIADAKSRGQTVVTEETGVTYFGSMCYANDASALGVGLGTGEIPREKLSDEAVRRDFSLYSNVLFDVVGGREVPRRGRCHGQFLPGSERFSYRPQHHEGSDRRERREGGAEERGARLRLLPLRIRPREGRERAGEGRRARSWGVPGPALRDAR